MIILVRQLHRTAICLAKDLTPLVPSPVCSIKSYVNTMAVDAPAPCVARSSTAMVLTT